MVHPTALHRALDKQDLLIARLAGRSQREFRWGHKQESLPAGILQQGIIAYEADGMYMDDCLGAEADEAMRDPLFRLACRDVLRDLVRCKTYYREGPRRGGVVRNYRVWALGYFALRMFRAGYLTAQKQAA